MKKILSMLCAVLFVASCAKDAEPVVEYGSGEGAMRMSVSLASDELQDKSVSIKIYKVDDAGERQLVRRYTSIQDVPDYLALLADDYVAVVEVGEKSVVNFDQKYYKGESAFTVNPREVSAVVVDCLLQSTIVSVAYDATIAQKLDAGYKTTVAVADVYDQSAINSGDVLSLVYTESKEGYYILPEGNTSLVWRFEGNHPVEGAISAEGVISDVKAAAKYTISLKYSKDGDGAFNIVASVDETIQEFDDNISFSPDPTIIGQGFSVNEVQSSIGEARTYNISALATITTLNVAIGGVNHDLLNTTVEGITLTKTNDTTYSVTISEAAFASVNGGTSAVSFHIEDADGGKKEADVIYEVQGIMPINSTDFDLWFGNATFRAKVLNTSASTIAIAYRANGGEWINATAVAGADNIYTATIDTFSADKTYEYKLVLDSADAGCTLSYVTPVGMQLPNAGFEEWYQDGAYFPYAQGASPFWLTGNEGSQMANTNLTTPKNDPRPGSTGTTSAYLKSTFASVLGIGKFAAGNLFTGTFTVSGTNGTVGFGRDFAFNAKPKSLSVWMKHNEGVIDNGNHASGQDLCTMMVLITDWATPYAVNTKDESTFFTMDDLATMDGVIGYGYYQTHESNTEWKEYTLNITYREDMKHRSPRKVVVSFTPSGYGDYFCGSTNSWMYVDDVKFNY